MDDYEYQKEKIREFEHRIMVLEVQTDFQNRQIKRLCRAIDCNSIAIIIISVGIMIMKIISYL